MIFRTIRWLLRIKASIDMSSPKKVTWYVCFRFCSMHQNCRKLKFLKAPLFGKSHLGKVQVFCQILGCFMINHFLDIVDVKHRRAAADWVSLHLLLSKLSNKQKFWTIQLVVFRKFRLSSRFWTKSFHCNSKFIPVKEMSGWQKQKRPSSS